MAYLVLSPMDITPRWTWGGSTAYLYIVASQSFYEATTGEYIAQGQVTNLQSFAQKYTCTVSGTTVTLPTVTLATTTDSTVPNTTYTAILTDSSNTPRFTLLPQFFVDPDYFPVPAEASVLVASAGSPTVDGIYTYTGQQSGKPFYNLTGTDPTVSAIAWNFEGSQQWMIFGASGELYVSGEDVDYPWEVVTWSTAGSGLAPVPNVSYYPTTVTSTWEQLTLSNQASATVGAPFQWNGPFWNVAQTKQYVNTVVGSGSTPYASNLVAGKTKLDTAPASATSPIAVGVNSTIFDSLAPKANPTFTGTVTLPNTNLTGTLAITGGMTTTTTVAATGNVTGANLSGTNTGNITKSGENYLSLTGQALTANAVNLSGTNVTGTLAATRMPALTGDVTTSAGAVATTIANDAVTTAKILNVNVTNAKIATGVDAVKIADGSVSNAEFQRLDGVTSAIQTQIDAKAPLVSPTFTGTPVAPTAAPSTNTTQLATTAFVTAAVVATPLPYLTSYLAATQTYNANAVLANTPISVTVATGGIYTIQLTVFSSSVVAPLKMDFAGTASFTNFRGEWIGWETPIDAGIPTSVTGAMVTSAGTDFSGSATADMYYTFNGSCSINAGGTFILRAAQVGSDASNTTLILGSSITLLKLN